MGTYEKIPRNLLVVTIVQIVIACLVFFLCIFFFAQFTNFLFANRFLMSPDLVSLIWIPSIGITALFGLLGSLFVFLKRYSTVRVLLAISLVICVLSAFCTWTVAPNILSTYLTVSGIIWIGLCIAILVLVPKTIRYPQGSSPQTLYSVYQQQYLELQRPTSPHTITTAGELDATKLYVDDMKIDDVEFVYADPDNPTKPTSRIMQVDEITGEQATDVRDE